MLKISQVLKIRKSIDTDEVALSRIFNLLGDKNRFRILKILIRHGELCVSDLATILKVSVSSVSQHLRILEMSNLVVGERMGQMMCYKPIIKNPKIKMITNLMK